MVSYEKADTIIKALAYSTGVIPIGIMYYDFNLIDTNALANGLFYKGNDSLMYDSPNRTVNPYLLKNVAVAAVLNTEEIPFGSGYIEFQPASSLFFTNKNVSISSMYADFGDGDQSISFGNTVIATYLSGGIKIVKFTINFSDNTQHITYSSITISNSSAMRFGAPKNADEVRDIEDTQYGSKDMTNLKNFIIKVHIAYIIIETHLEGQ